MHLLRSETLDDDMHSSTKTEIENSVDKRSLEKLLPIDGLLGIIDRLEQRDDCRRVPDESKGSGNRRIRSICKSIGEKQKAEALAK